MSTTNFKLTETASGTGPTTRFTLEFTSNSRFLRICPWTLLNLDKFAIEKCRIVCCFRPLT
jgi:hypothetical protein